MIYQGNSVSPGMATGRVFVYKPLMFTVNESYFEDGEESKYIKMLEKAVKAANEELDKMLASFENSTDDGAKIISAHKELLMDEEILDKIHNSISTEHKMPDYAVSEAFEEFIALLSKAKDPLISGRVSDLKDVRNRILKFFDNKEKTNLSHLNGKVILVTHELLPSETAGLDRDNVIGIITEVGGTTSHTAIIARDSGIPAILGVSGITNVLSDGDEIAIDAVNGTVITELSAEERAKFCAQKADYDKKAGEMIRFLDTEPIMADGTRFEIGINIGSDQYFDGYRYCDFVGLFRTEFLYMQSNHLPTEDEQYSAYKKVIENANGKPVTIRTMDIGGDKTLEYLELPKELNPFLGKRALRFCLEQREIFKTQLRAILRASAYGQVWIMFPMVGSIDDVINAKVVLDEAKNDLNDAGQSYGADLKVGVMIEIPSAAFIADMIAKEVDFASIGTNDLCQYLVAADRMNSEIAGYYQSMAPAMIRALNMIAEEFISSGKPLSVCGEIAGDPKAAVVLAGLGIRKFSMNSSNITMVKASLSKVTADEAARISHNVLNMRTQDEVLSYLTLIG